MDLFDEDELRSSNTLLAGADSANPHDAVDLGAVRTAVERGRHVLWRSQRAAGSWEAPGDCGPVCTAQVLVTLRFLGRLGADDATAGARWLSRTGTGCS